MRTIVGELFLTSISSYLHFSLHRSSSSSLQIKFENRYKGDIGNDCLISVDTTDCRINEPWPFDTNWSARWSSFKFGKKAALRYEIALCILTGDIVWYNGPFPAGMFNDWVIFNTKGLRANLDEHERVEADRGYRPGDPRVCKTPNTVFHPKEKWGIRRKVMARQEALNARIKKYKILSTRFRHKMDLHHDVFRAVLVINQIAFKCGEKLYSCTEYSDL